jgi:hypothetical protein
VKNNKPQEEDKEKPNVHDGDQRKIKIHEIIKCKIMEKNCIHFKENNNDPKMYTEYLY